jgi:hypothetical protein
MSSCFLVRFQNDLDKNDDGTYINVPSQLHSTLSIINNMHQMRNNDVLDIKQEKFNSISNSNLNNNQNLSKNNLNNKIVHSEANLVDITSETFSNITKLDTYSHSTILPPRRPPPPIPLLNKKESNDIKLVDFETDFNIDQIRLSNQSIEHDKHKNHSNSLHNDFFSSFEQFSTNEDQRENNLCFKPDEVNAPSKVLFDVFDDNFEDAFRQNIDKGFNIYLFEVKMMVFLFLEFISKFYIIP